MKRSRIKALRAGVLTVAAALGLTVAAAPAMAERCQVNCLAPGDYDFTLSFEGLERSYKVHVPDSYTGDRPVPLLLDMHGLGSSAERQRDISGQLAQSDRRGFIAIWPQGFDNSWNGYKCCGTALSRDIDDVAFLREVVARVRKRTNIAVDRIYATGLSNGGSMSHRLACDAADLISGAAPLSQTLNEPERCKPSRAIDVVAFHGIFDLIAPYGGAPLRGFQSARASFASWATIQGCEGPLQRRQLGLLSRAETFTDCRNGARVGLVSVSGGHVTYFNFEKVKIADYIWDNVFTE